MEYARGTDPRVPGSPDLLSIIYLTGGGDAPDVQLVTFPVNPRAGDLTYFLDSGPSLEQWSVGGSYHPGSYQFSGFFYSAALSAGGNQVLLAFLVPQWPYPSRTFFRLRASQP